MIQSTMVAKGFTKAYGIDYLEMFTLVTNLNTIRVFLVLATNLDWPLKQLEVKIAFLDGGMEEKVYIDAPP